MKILGAKLEESYCVHEPVFPFYTAEEDYSTVIKILEFNSGSTYVDVNISIINDESIEGNETFTIYITIGVGVNVSETEITIIDDDEEDDNNGDDDDDSNY